MTDQRIEAVAAAMWKAEAVDSGSPESVAKRRTPEEFAGQSDETRAKWHKFARAAIAALTPTPQEAAKVLLDKSYADPVGYGELLSEQPLGGIIGLQRSLRAISEDSHE